MNPVGGAAAAAGGRKPGDGLAGPTGTPPPTLGTLGGRRAGCGAQSYQAGKPGP